MHKLLYANIGMDDHNVVGSEKRGNFVQIPVLKCL